MNTFKPFNLEEALAGKPVITRNGYPIIELKYFQTIGSLAVVRKEPDEKLISYFIRCDGTHYDNVEYSTDLFMAPIKKEGWVVMYHNNDTKDRISGTKIWASKEDVEILCKGCEGIVGVAKIEWEE